MFPPLLVGAVVSGLATVGSLRQFYRQQLGPMTLREVRALEHLSPTPIAHATSGLVKLVGTLGCEHPGVSLQGGVATAVREQHHYAVEGRGLRARRVLLRVERSEEPFWVEDDTGRVMLDPARCRIDFEADSGEGESLVDELRLRLGERVALIGEVQRGAVLAQHPMRRSQASAGEALRFVHPPVLTWRTEPEVMPRLLPPTGGVALSASTVGMAVLGALLQI
ncbi:MAG: hypothetical protein Q8S73_16390 [Deltaproteobacteria bacterium]|nr:hypothetical protein [Myxococcales bacterium]MDP3215688.1 hypothetical protein [Deltaproteobacteria bacterium]